MFNSEKFIFNDIHSDDMNVILVDFDNDVLKEHGLEFETELITDTITGYSEPFFYEGKHKVGPIILNIALVDKNNNAKEWSIEERKKVISWLMQSEFKPFISQDDANVIYYFKCVGIKKKFNHNMQGVLEVTMQPSNSFAYTPVVYYNHISRDNQLYSFNIDNISNLDIPYYPIIEITHLDETTDSIEIQNTSTSSIPFTIHSLSYGDKITIDGFIKTIVDKDGDSRLLDSNREWLYFKKGINTLNVLGKCEINIKAQYPLLV